MPHRRCLELFINHITPADNALLKLINHEGASCIEVPADREDPDFFIDRFQVDESESGYDFYIWERDEKTARELLGAAGFSEYFVNIVAASILDGDDYIRLGTYFGSESRFKKPDEHVVDPSAETNNEKLNGGCLASFWVKKREQAQNECPSTAMHVKLQRDHDEQLTLECMTTRGPVHIGIEHSEDGVILTTFSTADIEETNDMFDARISVGHEGTKIWGQNSRVISFNGEDDAHRPKQ